MRCRDRTETSECVTRSDLLVRPSFRATVCLVARPLCFGVPGSPTTTVGPAVVVSRHRGHTATSGFKPLSFDRPPVVVVVVTCGIDLFPSPVVRTPLPHPPVTHPPKHNVKKKEKTPTTKEKVDKSKHHKLSAREPFWTVAIGVPAKVRFTEDS